MPSLVTTFFYLSLRRLRKRGIGDALNLYLLVTVTAFFGALLVRKMTVDHETRYLLTVYFALCVGLLYLVPRRRWAWRIVIPMSCLALVSHGVILWTNFNHEQGLAEERACASMTHDQAFRIFEQIDPPPSLARTGRSGPWRRP